jgi:hypothetical protein
MVKVLDVDRQGKIRLSRKALLDAEGPDEPHHDPGKSPPCTKKASFLTASASSPRSCPTSTPFPWGCGWKWGPGTRPPMNGLTHFLEHMAFKGTPRRTVL